MKFVLILVIWTGHGREMMEPTSVDWWTCRVGELRQSAGWNGTYAGHPIIGAVCLRQDQIALRNCENVKGCA